MTMTTATTTVRLIAAAFTVVGLLFTTLLVTALRRRILRLNTLQKLEHLVVQSVQQERQKLFGVLLATFDVERRVRLDAGQDLVHVGRCERGAHLEVGVFVSDAAAS
uniref:Uncharacterized protein n=1 Tax=Cacopsylla melanoneura TaxID=428564 RepID=A0A8D8LY05_9HEMI